MLAIRIENSSHTFDFDYFINLRYGKIIFMLVISLRYFLASIRFKELILKQLLPPPQKLELTFSSKW